MPQNKNSFIFDMDGVLIDSERAWVPHQRAFSTALFGEEIYNQIGSTVGLSIDTIYQNAVKHGFSMNLGQFYDRYDKQAEIIYGEAEPTQDIDILFGYLRNKQFKIGIVSSSRKKWIDLVLAKFDSKHSFDFVLSLNDEKSFKPKPSPDGYVAAMQALNSDPDHTTILEDSNPGIASAKASGAYTIAYTEHLMPGYEQHGADDHASNIDEIIALLDARS
jgi:beta-phosphoglucomutase-like phosphatase (HAD superfamily)